MPDPVHNFINVRDANDELRYSFHGLTTDTDTLEAQTWSILPGSTLRFYPMPVAMLRTYLPDIDSRDCVETDIFTGTPEEVEKKVLICIDAGNFMNQQGLSYDLFSQNSNSVAHSLVIAMGLKFPKENEIFLAPGHDKSLLPENWSPSFSEDKRIAIFGDHLNHDESVLQVTLEPLTPASPVTSPPSNTTSKEKEAEAEEPEAPPSREIMALGIEHLHPIDRLMVQVLDGLEKTPAPEELCVFDPANPRSPYKLVQMMPFEGFVSLIYASYTEDLETAQQPHVSTASTPEPK